MKAKQSFGHGYSPQKLAAAAVFVCVLFPIIFLALIKSNSHQFASFSLQLSIHSYDPLSMMKMEKEEGEGGMKQTVDANLTSLQQPLQMMAVRERNDSIELQLPPPNAKPADANSSSSSDIGISKELLEQNEKKQVDDNNISIIDIIDNNQKGAIQVANDQKPEQNYTDQLIVESKLECEFSGPRSDTCTMLGDIRVVIGKNSTTIMFVSSTSPTNSTKIKIRPYARKWEAPVMDLIEEVSITPVSEPGGHAPTCSVQHSVPAVVFSTGGFVGNLFHDFTDVLVPLFATARQFGGEVQFLVTDFNPKWIAKYKPVLDRLSRYQIINMDGMLAQVHCFPRAQLGLLSHKVLGMDPSKTPNGYSIRDFRQILRSSFNLNRESTNKIRKSSRKRPRLLVILRRGSRSLTNAKQVVSTARSIGFKVVTAGSIGFKVVTAGPEDTMDLAKFAKTVNSADVMVGVHGAGLANMVFLPTNATLVQIVPWGELRWVPWGELRWACWHDFGEPAADMGLSYVQYEIKEEESSLIEEYPRDHAVFKDPMSIHRQGWNQLWFIFLNKQKVKLDVDRFRGVLLEIYQSIKN